MRTRTVKKIVVKCYNCEKKFEGTTRTDFCSFGCKEIAALVRFIRRYGMRRIRAEEDLLDAYIVKLYDVITDQSYRDRHKVSPQVRQQVIERDAGRCVVCHERGEEVDHVAYIADVNEYNAASNLRYVCRRCHRAKVYTEEDGPAYARVEVKWTDKQLRRLGEVMQRATSPEPLLRCDDHEHWSPFTNARNIMPDMRRTLEEAGCSQKKVADFMHAGKASIEREKARKAERRKAKV